MITKSIEIVNKYEKYKQENVMREWKYKYFTIFVIIQVVFFYKNLKYFI